MRTLKCILLFLCGILFSCNGKSIDNTNLPPVLGETFTSNTYANTSKVSLINQQGKPFDGLQTGKIKVVDFFFTSCPTICPKMTSHLKEVQLHFAKNEQVEILSYSIDGLNDTPEVLKNYTRNHRIDTHQWQLITGEPSAIFQMSQAYKVMAYDDSDGTERNLIHDGTFVLVDDKNQIRGYYNGLELKDTQRLISDIEKLLNTM
ncbi:MAG: SCO family protein [Bacteroidota bacterium]